MLTVYVPTSFTLPPAPDKNPTIVVPAVIPVPLRVCPNAIAPECDSGHGQDVAGNATCEHSANLPAWADGVLGSVLG
jgi:hypothetical protein